MPFVDKGWFCASNDCVWSEAAVEEARLIFLDKENPKTAFCYSGAAYRNDINDFYLCSKTLELCKLRRAEFPNGPGSRPCREMTPTEFWQENPMLVELRRKICEPQECPDGYLWLGAAKLKGETLPIDASAIIDLGDGMALTNPSAPNWPGTFTKDDEDCSYGCILRECEQTQNGCLDTKTTTCRLCSDDGPFSEDACRHFIERCREVSLLEERADALCVFSDTGGDGIKERYGCPRGYSCSRLYDEDFPQDARIRGVCERDDAEGQLPKTLD